MTPLRRSPSGAFNLLLNFLPTVQRIEVGGPEHPVQWTNVSVFTLRFPVISTAFLLQSTKFFAGTGGRSSASWTPLLLLTNQPQKLSYAAVGQGSHSYIETENAEFVPGNPLGYFLFGHTVIGAGHFWRIFLSFVFSREKFIFYFLGHAQVGQKL